MSWSGLHELADVIFRITQKGFYFIVKLGQGIHLK